MFVECLVEVEAGLADVEKGLDRLRSDMEDWADAAYRQGEELRARVGPGGGLAKNVGLEIGLAEIHALGLVYPIKWTATGATLLFPELNADLVLSKKGPQRTTLRLRGTYQPPLGAVGRMADRAGLGRVAEATVQDWLERLGSSLSREAA